MSCKSIFFAVLILGSMFSEASPVELKVKSEVLQSIAKSFWGGVVLPEFEIYTTAGIGIYHQLSLPGDFKKKLAIAIDRSEDNGRRLSHALEQIALPDIQQFNHDMTAFDVVFVEYWAEWCTPCKTQMKQVHEFIAENPALKILWLKVEKDPNKLELNVIKNNDDVEEFTSVKKCFQLEDLALMANSFLKY